MVQQQMTQPLLKTMTKKKAIKMRFKIIQHIPYRVVIIDVLATPNILTLHIITIIMVEVIIVVADSVVEEDVEVDVAAEHQNKLILISMHIIFSTRPNKISFKNHSKKINNQTITLFILFKIIKLNRILSFQKISQYQDLLNVLDKINLLFIMNTDQYPTFSQNQYFALKNDSDANNSVRKDDRLQGEHDLVKNHTPDYGNFTQNHYNPLPQNQPKYQPVQPNFGQKPHMDQFESPNRPMKAPQQVPYNQQNQKPPTHPGQVIIYNSMERPQLQTGRPKSYEKISIVVEGPNKKQSVIYGQSVGCQRCGLVANGSIKLHKGRTVCAWASCLFLTTGIFFFLPCVMDRCKDTWIECARCGHKKAVVKSSCCF